ncbi:MAG: Ig-like domain-containing protein, partial [Pseudomonadota bacterium]
GDNTFVNPNEQPTQFIDLGGAGTGGNDFSTIYVDGARQGQDADVPLSIAAVDMSIFDVNDTHLTTATITLTNAQAGDELAVDQDVMDELGIFADIFFEPGEVVIELDGYATLASYETAIRAITYSNDNANPSTVQRIIEVMVSDGIVDSPTATTLISYGVPGQSPVTGANLYVGLEDTVLTRAAAEGLIADDSDPQGNALTLTGAMDALGGVITVGTNHTMPSGSTLNLAADGSFTYTPAPNYSGVETITYEVSDGAFSSQGFATFDVQAEVDAVTLTATAPANSTLEDEASASVSIAAFSADTDGSEVQRIDALNIPLDVVLTDGTNTFRSSVTGTSVDITDWNLANIHVLPTANNDVDVTIEFEVQNTESNGDISIDTTSVTFEIDAVADAPIVTVYEGGGAVDATVSLSNLIEAVLFDDDGSETITQFQISDIPNGGDILLNGVALAQTSNTVSFVASDIPDLEFRPPVTGNPVIYTMQVAVTSTETNPENGVAQATATRANVGLIIDLNNNDDPVLAIDDRAATAAGESVVIEVLRNDIVPDGGEAVNAINGELWAGVPIVMPGGQGTVEVTGQGDLRFNAATDFAGSFTFTYELIDIDGSTDTANVRIDVLPSWVLAGDTATAEGDTAVYTLTLDGGLEQGQTASVTIMDTSISASTADREDLATALQDAVTAAGPESGFAYVSGEVTYTAPAQNFTAVSGAGPAFVDISGTGTPLNHASDSVSRVPLSFDFNFYDGTYDEIFVSTDGFITFGTGAVGSTNTALDGSALGGRAIIAPFWDDLTTGPGDIHTLVSSGSVGERTFTVQWTGVGNANDGGTATFQVVMSEADGSIAFVYDDVTFAGLADDGATATIGMQGGSSIFDPFSFDSASVADNSSILFTRGSDPTPTLTFSLDIVDDTDFEQAEIYRIELGTSDNSAIGARVVQTEIAISDNRDPIAFDDNVAIDDNDSFSINVLTN